MAYWQVLGTAEMGLALIQLIISSSLLFISLLTTASPFSVNQLPPYTFKGPSMATRYRHLAPLSEEDMIRNIQVCNKHPDSIFVRQATYQDVSYFLN